MFSCLGLESGVGRRRSRILHRLGLLGLQVLLGLRVEFELRAFLGLSRASPAPTASEAQSRPDTEEREEKWSESHQPASSHNCSPMIAHGWAISCVGHTLVHLVATDDPVHADWVLTTKDSSPPQNLEACWNTGCRHSRGSALKFHPHGQTARDCPGHGGKQARKTSQSGRGSNAAEIMPRCLIG